MYRVVMRFVVAFLCLLVLSAGNVHAARDKTLVTIDGLEYTGQDYRNWWRYWQEPGMEFFGWFKMNPKARTGNIIINRSSVFRG